MCGAVTPIAEADSDRAFQRLAPEGRAGDYRVINTFNSTRGVVHLLAAGHRREIDR